MLLGEGGLGAGAFDGDGSHIRELNCVLDTCW